MFLKWTEKQITFKGMIITLLWLLWLCTLLHQNLVVETIAILLFSQNMCVRNSGRAQSGNSVSLWHWLRSLGDNQQIWRDQDNFTHMFGTWMGRTQRLELPARTHSCLCGLVSSHDGGLGLETSYMVAQGSNCVSSTKQVRKRITF